MRQGCLSLVAAALILFTAGFGTGALYLTLHDSRGHARHPNAGSLALLAVVILIPVAGGSYLIYLDHRTKR